MRKPDLIIGPAHNPQTYRWHIIKFRGWQFSLHKWMRSDDDRALHDHVADNVSLILNGGFFEIVREYKPGLWAANSPFLKRHNWQRDGEGRWYKDRRQWRKPWRLYFRRAETPHRVELAYAGKIRAYAPVWSLWIRKPPRRVWGFHCPRGWRPWTDYVAEREHYNTTGTSTVGSGCG
jgi:hypothetical protein